MPEPESAEKSIFLAAIEIEDSVERTAYLDDACRDNALLRGAVDALLQAHGPCRQGNDGAAVEQLGGVIGPYKLLERIGEGGFGIVYMAEQLQPVRRRVALKVIKPGMDTRLVVARFEAERQALALMDHANIAQIFDGGETALGRPFFVMELVRGMPITDYCDEAELSIRERLSLFVAVCQAVQHAHQKGIIHRDLKPSNVLVTMHDDKPIVKVIDFGVAKAIGQQLTEKTLFTNFAQMIGTPLYMSPEQAQMSGLDADTRADIYSLGVLLYELLTGTTPFDKERLRTAAFDEIRRIIREEEPVLPSQRRSTPPPSTTAESNRRRFTQDQLIRQCRGDLDWIVMKCLEKDRERRYATANELATDLGHYLADEPVRACPPTAAYRLRKFVRRHQGPVWAATAFAILLIVGIVTTTWQAIRATQAERLAKTHERQTLTQMEKAETNFQLAKDAVDKYLNAVTNHPKLNENDFHPLRKELLETAVPFYQKFAQERGDDPESEAARGFAFHRLAQVRDVMGEKEAALAEYESMRTIFATLVAKYPGVPAYRVHLARSHNNRAILLAALGKIDEAESAYRTALTIKEQLADAHPDVPVYRWDFARSHNGLGLLLKDKGRPIEAEAAFRAALRIQEQLIPLFHDDPIRRSQLAASHNNLGILLSEVAKKPDAETAHRAALRIYEQLVAEFPKVAHYRTDLAMSYNNLAKLQQNLRNYAEAEAGYLAALDHYKHLAAEFPSVPVYRQCVARSHHNLGNLLSAMERLEDAHAAFMSALPIREQLATDFPNVTSYALDLGSTYKDLGILIRKQGESQAALDWFAKAITKIEAELKKEPHSAKAGRYLLRTFTARADLLDALQRFSDAAKDWDRASELADDSQKAKYQARRNQSLRLGGL